MRISSHKSLIREIAPGVIQIGNNPFAPTLMLDDIQTKAEVAGEPLLLGKDLDNITGTSLDYETAIIAQGYFANRPIAENLPILISGDLDEELAALDAAISTERTERLDDVSSLHFNLYRASGLLNTAIETEASGRIEAVKDLQETLEVSSGILRADIDLEISERIKSIDEISESLEVASGILNSGINDLHESLEIASGILQSDVNLETQTREQDIEELNQSLQIASGILRFDLDAEIQSLKDEDQSLHQRIDEIQGDGIGISYAEANNLAKKWALILG
tara:strand:+ start:7404 stop:8240 length:837 start_codon:yes stop_codon:yes gene_type:complete